MVHFGKQAGIASASRPRSLWPSVVIGIVLGLLLGVARINGWLP